MKNYLKKLISQPDITPETLTKIEESKQKLKLISEQIISMTEVFREGGSITFDELSSYSISSPEKPIKYPTGKNCFSYRIPSNNKNQIMFYCTFEPINGEEAEYGWHNHPDCDEQVIQLTGSAKANNKLISPFTKSVFKAGEYHNYSMKEYGTILVTFTRK